MNVLIFGGTGLLGSAAAQIFIDRGHKVKTIALPPLPEGAPITKEMDIEFGNFLELTDEELEKPLSTVSGENNNKTIDLTFSAIDFIPGDANCDGKLTAMDAAFIAKMLAEQKGNELPSHADFNKDGKITALDAASIARYLAEQSMNK